MVILAAASMAIIIFSVAIFIFNLRNNIFELIRDDYENQIEHLDFALCNFLEEAYSNVETIASIDIVRTGDDSEFTNFLYADEKTFQYDIGETEQEIIEIFSSFKKNHTYISSVYMGRENGSFVRSHKRARPTKYDPRERPWYILAKENPEEVIRTEPYESLTTPDINIGVEKALIDDKGEFFGVVGMDITLDNLTDYIYGIKVGEKGWAVLIDENGTILVSKYREDRLKNISELGLENPGEIMNQPGGYTILNVNSGKNWLFYDTSEKLGWKIGLVIPDKEINSEVWNNIYTNIIVLVLSLAALGLLILLVLQKFILNPIKKLSDSTALISRTGNLEHSINVGSRDEIGDMTKSFNKMMESINKSNKALKDSKRALLRLNNELEEKVKERTEDLVHANERLKELDRLKSMFIASMSHELRTPLNSIIGFTSLILMGMAGKINNEQKKQLTMVKSSANHLLELVTDVIDVSKIEAGKVSLSIGDFDLIEVLKEVRDSFEVTAGEKGISLALKVPGKLMMRSDRLRVKQVIMNFVNNAFKFTMQGKVEIKAGRKDGKIFVDVSDTGMGIKEEDMGKLFKQFSRIQVENFPKVEGTGLGLYLSKKIAGLLKGEVKVKSVFGRGSIFTVELPLQ
ncbi:MAG: HAMP domain-containing protein [Actinobacteria bacterium]|nr:HAMP domain-containing protein [Actinomycetota bacterium]